MATINSLQQPRNRADNDQNSNQFSSTSFIPEFVHRQSIKKINSGPALTAKQKIKQFQYDLFTSLTIYTPNRLKSIQLRKQLKNYQYERIQRKIQSQTLQKFGKAEQQLFRQQQNLILMLNSVMKQFRSDREKYFYILTKKSNKVLFFHHKFNQFNKTIQSSLLICSSMLQKTAPQLQSSKIAYQVLPCQQCQKLQLTNQSINIYWSKILNKILQSQKSFKSFHILSNYAFPNSTQILPTELFNGLQQRKEYSYIAKPTTNLLGEPVQQVYRMRIGGLWTVENVGRLVEGLGEVYGEKFFQVEFEVDRITGWLKDGVEDQEGNGGRVG